jgi:type I restriction enzyme M protein
MWTLSEANTGFTEKASLILANPPFKGSLDREAVDGKILSVVIEKKTELLFLALIKLTLGGRAAVIVPDGVLFGSSKAHQQIRTEIIDRQKLQAVISMPSGVFKPYAGVSTAILIFTKTIVVVQITCGFMICKLMAIASTISASLLRQIIFLI